MDASTAWAATGSLATVATAAIAAWAAHLSRQTSIQANAAAASASKAAEALTAIERERRHDELAPVFELSLEDGRDDRAQLMVTLSGGAMDSLDEVTITILDETGADHWGRGLPDGVSQDGAECFVWGPFEFETAASDQVVGNRQSKARPYSRLSGKNWDVLALSRTRPGLWMTGTTFAAWKKQHSGKPLRLQITSTKTGYEPWIQLHEINSTPPHRARYVET